MKRWIALSVPAAAALWTLVPVAAHADHNPVPAACVVVDAPPLHLQAGYAPHGPEDCTPIP